ncbi:MAG: hypothetical protein E6826_08545, partial [Anaerococcus vaginalis]|nr:hypothetical protein [Anaerococcus vaginalis]
TKQDGGNHLITDEYIEELGVQGQRIKSDAANATDFVKTYVNLDVDNLVVGKTYTFSVYVKNNRDVTAGLRVNGFNWNFAYELNANECKRFIITGKRDSMDGYWKNRIQFQLRSANKAQFVDMTVSRPQLELGSIATDWSPNPDDFNIKIDNLSKEIDKKANNSEISNLQKDILVSYMTSSDTDIQNIALKSKDIGKAIYRYLEVTNQTNAENAVKTAEDNQTSDNVTAAQAAIDVLTNQATKDQLQARLDAVSNAIAAANTATTTTNTATSSDDTTESTVDPNTTSRTPTSVTNDGTYTYYSY